MKSEIKEEALEQLKTEIVSGFEGGAELFEGIREMFYDEDEFDENWLKNEISERLTKHIEHSKNWQRPTDFERLARVFDQLNKDGIVSLHKAGYTRQDAEDDCHEMMDVITSFGGKIKGYCYYHTQDLERAINSKMLYLGYDSMDGSDASAMEVVQVIREKLIEEGFEIEWNGSLDTRLFIKDFDWKKVPDGIDYNHNRILDIHKPSASNLSKKKPLWKFW